MADHTTALDTPITTAPPIAGGNPGPDDTIGGLVSHRLSQILDVGGNETVFTMTAILGSVMPDRIAA
jgi:hypothetical protein